MVGDSVYGQKFYKIKILYDAVMMAEFVPWRICRFDMRSIVKGFTKWYNNGRRT